MGKKYLETKKDTLESSVLGVWKTAIEEGEARMDGRTSEYRNHRRKLESARSRREEKKVVVKKEEPETINGAGEHAFEVGTDRYAEYTQKITPGQIEEAFLLLDEQQLVLGEGTFTEEQCEIIDVLQEMTEEEHDELLEQMDDDQLEMYEGILKSIGKGIGKVAKRFGTAQGRAGAALKKQQKKSKLIKTKADTKTLKKKNRAAAADAGIGVRGKATKAARAVGKGATKAGKAVGKGVAAVAGKMRKKKEEVDLDEKHDTHVDPKDRDELDKEADAKGGSETAKKMKKAKEPEPNQMAEAQSGDKEAYKKFFNAALKKFKVGSPAELKGDQKKKFYDYIDANWEGDNEKAEGAMSQVREFKIQSMKAALAKVWGMEEGKNPFAEGELPPALKKAIDAKKKDKEEKDEEVGKNGKTETGKKAAVIDLKPKIKD